MRAWLNEALAGSAAACLVALVACEPGSGARAFDGRSAQPAAAARRATRTAHEPQTAATSKPKGAPNATPTAATSAPPAATPASKAAAAVIAAHKPIDQASARAVLEVVPALAQFAASFVPFTDSEVDAALRRGGRSRQSVQVWTFMPAMFVWNPVPEKAWLVLSGHANGRPFFAVIEPLGGGRFALAGSTELDEGETSVAIGASEQYPKQLSWSTCYGCAGEGGTIRLADDGRVELNYR